jgi:hypothetical protein
MGQKYETQCLKKSEGLGPSLYLIEKLLLMLLNNIFIHTAISIKVVHERLLGIAKKLMNFQSRIPSCLSRSYSTFPVCSWTTLIEIAVYINPLL